MGKWAIQILVDGNTVVSKELYIDRDYNGDMDSSWITQDKKRAKVFSSQGAAMKWIASAEPGHIYTIVKF